MLNKVRVGYSMKTKISFKYGENHYVFAAENDAVYELESGVTVSVVKKYYNEYDAAEWVLYFENKSDKNSKIFSGINDCDTLFPLEYHESKRPGYMPKVGDPCVIAMNGSVDGSYYWSDDAVSATEFNLKYEYLGDSAKTFGCKDGRSSAGTMPFFDVTASRCGYICAIGWTGDWRAEFEKCERGIHAKTGLKYTNFYLKPGEKVRTGSTLVMKYNGNEDKYNKFRSLIRSHISHKSCTHATRDGLMAFELWGGLTSDEMIERINEFRDHDIHFEDVWIDAGWYGACLKCDDAFSGDWSEHTGNWIINPRTHADALRDVRDAAKAAGMNLMLWFEPERAIKTLPIINEHPNWFISRDGDGSLLLNYGNDEAKKYIRDLLINYVKDLDMSCYRQDFNIDISHWLKNADDEDRKGITEIKHITGMYEIWDSLLEEFPNLIIDNCSSGGRRIDIETLRRSIPYFRSDYQCNFNENSEVLQTHNSNISLYLPYNGYTSKTKNDTYAIRSSYSSSWGGAFYNAIFQSMSESDFAWAKKITDEYRRIRKYFSLDFYNHASLHFDSSAWVIWQYHDSENDSGIVMAFRRSDSPFDAVNIELKGIDPKGIYIYENLDNGTLVESNNVLAITLREKRSCTIIEYNRK